MGGLAGDEDCLLWQCLRGVSGQASAGGERKRFRCAGGDGGSARHRGSWLLLSAGKVRGD
jgi:hypothetical protein